MVVMPYSCVISLNSSSISIDVSGSMVYNKELGNNWRIRGSVYRDYNGESYWINSDASIEEGTFRFNKGYKIEQNKNVGTQVKKVTSASSATIMQAYNNVPTATYNTFDFEIITANFKSSSGTFS